MKYKLATATVVVALVGFSADAATILEHEVFAAGEQAQARQFAADFWGTRATINEDFEDATVESYMVDGQDVGRVFSSVGVFTGLGGVGGGGSVVGTPTSIQIRDIDQFGRQNLVPEDGSQYLDSNDTLGFTLDINTEFLNIAPLGTISFFLMDAADQGATFVLSYGGDETKTLTGQSDGTINWFAIKFDAPTTMATIRFSNEVRMDDGFGVDGFQVAPIPIPPAVAMLLTGLAGLGFIGRRRRAAA